ncbi:MAG: permease [bacterium]
MFYKIIPILLIAMIAMAIIDLYFTPERLQKYFGCNSGIRGWIYAIMLGILISGPPYILYPMLGELKKHGMKDSLLSVFLYNRNVKLQFLPVMVFYFGFVYTLLISIYIIIFSIIGGLIIKRLTK